MNVKKHRKLTKNDLNAAIDIFHDCVATCANHIQAGTATNFPTEDNFKLYLLWYSEAEFKKYLRLKDDYFLLPYRNGEKVKRVERFELVFGDTSNYHVTSDAFDTLFPEAEFTEDDIESLKTIPEHVNQILEKVVLEDKTWREAATELNITKDRIKNVMLHYRTKLRAKRNLN